jgi:hypothetical protein
LRYSSVSKTFNISMSASCPSTHASNCSTASPQLSAVIVMDLPTPSAAKDILYLFMAYASA